MVSFACLGDFGVNYFSHVKSKFAAKKAFFNDMRCECT